MSGICGAWAIDGDTGPDPSQMLPQLERRGPDGTRRWQDGAVFLGHTLLATTPEALVEILPLRDEACGCTITADVRLDNREDLIGALGLSNEPRIIGDGELILRGYLKWGEDCPKHLLGDFAFAIWDPREPRLFCARDQLGMRQLVYHHRPGGLFVFASEAEAVIAHARVPKRINEGRIADFLDRLEAIDLTSTVFEDVVRLPPAHSLTLDKNGAMLRQYWQLEPVAELKLDSDEAYSEAFLEVFTEAVRCRLRSAGPVGSMLSGGMDSNSAAAVAARLLTADGRGPLLTFSAVGPNPADCIETRTILAAIKAPGYSPTLIDYSALESSSAELIRLVRDEGQPFDGYMTLVRALYLSAHRRGVKVMLDGAGGDVVLTAGNRLAQLLRAGKIQAAVKEARAEKRFWGASANIPRDLLAAAWTAFVPKPLRHMRRHLSWRWEDRRARNGQGPLTSGFAKKIDLAGRRRRFRTSLGQESASRRILFPWHARMIAARERYDRIASALAIEPRDPFLDIRVVQLSRSLPPAQLQSDGWPKLILRRAMREMLAPEIIWRRGKEHLGWSFTQSLFRNWKDWNARISAQKELARYVPHAALAKSFANSASAMDMERNFELVFLSCWLERNQGADESFTRDGD